MLFYVQLRHLLKLLYTKSSVFSETFSKVAGVCPKTDSAVRHTCLTLGPFGLKSLGSLIEK